MNTTSRDGVAARDVGLLIIRIAVSIVFIFHGAQKLFGWFDGPGLNAFAGMLEAQKVPAPVVSAVLAACAEFFGGLLVLLGLALRVAVIPMVFTMLVAILLVHRSAFSLQHNGMEYALTLGLVLLGLGFTGAGRMSLDAALWPGGRKPPTPPLTSP